MNIFAVSTSPSLSAQMLCDQHVVKMTLESCQMLSTIWRLSGEQLPVYRGWGDWCGMHGKPDTTPFVQRLSHQNHPCTVWARSSVANYRWLAAHAIALAYEYQFRYRRAHFRWPTLHALQDPPSTVPRGLRTPHAQTMPEQYRRPPDEYVRAYRDFYVGEKSRFASWANGRHAPDWFLFHVNLN